MRISDWSSDVCSSDLRRHAQAVGAGHRRGIGRLHDDEAHAGPWVLRRHQQVDVTEDAAARLVQYQVAQPAVAGDPARLLPQGGKSEEHTSELQSLMRISYAVFCLKKKNITKTK